MRLPNLNWPEDLYADDHSRGATLDADLMEDAITHRMEAEGWYDRPVCFANSGGGATILDYRAAASSRAFS